MHGAYNVRPWIVFVLFKFHPNSTANILLPGRPSHNDYGAHQANEDNLGSTLLLLEIRLSYLQSYQP